MKRQTRTQRRPSGLKTLTCECGDDVRVDRDTKSVTCPGCVVRMEAPVEREVTELEATKRDRYKAAARKAVETRRRRLAEVAA